jgi:hypothetical protein
VQTLCRTRRIIITVTIIFLFIAGAHAEFVFKKDGAIIQGKVVGESGTSVTILMPDKKREIIPRKDIMRILYTDLYMGKVYLRMTNGETQEGYVVDEDQKSYIVRKEINNPDEMTILRAKVMYIARSNPTDLVGTANRYEIQLKWNAPYIPGKKYFIYLKKSGDADFIKADEVAGTKHILAKLMSSTTYRIYITSIDGAGIESLPSEQIEVTTLNNPPTAPGEIRKEKMESIDPGKSGINVSWNPSTDSDGEIAEYRIFKIPNNGDDVRLATTEKTELFISDTDLTDSYRIRIVAVDNKGAESESAVLATRMAFIGGKTPFIRIRPLFVYPFGKMGKIYGAGFGSGIGVFASDFIFQNSQIGIETGYIYWTGRKSDFKYMNMIPFQLSFGYHFFATEHLLFTPSISAGMVYMSTRYKNAAFVMTTKDAIEPIAAISLSCEYLLTSQLYLFAGGDYSVIYEKSGMQSFAGAHIGAGYKLF